VGDTGGDGFLLPSRDLALAVARDHGDEQGCAQRLARRRLVALGLRDGGSQNVAVGAAELDQAPGPQRGVVGDATGRGHEVEKVFAARSEVGDLRQGLAGAHRLQRGHEASGVKVRAREFMQ
jgi:hypothetical protein